jgi:hypothetical protein
MKQEFKAITVSVALDVILRKYAEDFKAHDGFEIIDREWFVDIHKNKVCFVIRTVKEEE